MQKFWTIFAVATRTSKKGDSSSLDEDRVTRVLGRPVGGASLVELLFLTRDFKATDPRDKIFALVGIASDVQEQDVEVFPRYDLSTDVVYRQLVLWYLIRKRNFGIFSFGGGRTPLSETHMDDLPSWVPDLTQPNAFTPFQKLPHGYNYSKDNFYNVFNYLEEWLTMLKANEDSRIEKLQFFHTDVHNPSLMRDMYFT
ncbi:heterokaryon incompatibility protein [Colletotrichum gloeosporioides Cg-14]|uniref:Heterokaryon incompatibility protein n=1 Tax=Colletotrichum gloeosporioides (strain Cg-14) TaxID=1237896 RepID=T0KU45_COLGC|nr:heterokaryon incompatibility protein [Colletotrichum gloeosporioides Cg-14]